MSQLGQDVSAKDEQKFSQLHTVNVYHIVLRGMVLILVKFYFFCLLTMLQECIPNIQMKFESQLQNYKQDTWLTVFVKAHMPCFCLHYMFNIPV